MKLTLILENSDLQEYIRTTYVGQHVEKDGYARLLEIESIDFKPAKESDKNHIANCIINLKLTSLPADTEHKKYYKSVKWDKFSTTFADSFSLRVYYTIIVK